MIAYSLKHVLELLPEATSLVKQAHVESDLPTDSRDSCVASALVLAYDSTISGKYHDPEDMTKLAKAISLYDLEDTLRPLRQELIKRANQEMVRSKVDPKVEYLRKEACLNERATPNAKSYQACTLVKQANQAGATPGEAVLRYSGAYSMDKKAAVDALSARYQASQDTGFAKLACAIDRLPDYGTKPETVLDICRTVSGMDEKLGLHFKGFDFYKEALVKEANVSVNICGKQVSLEALRNAKPHIAQYLGSDVAAELDSDPVTAKAAIEALPMDLKHLLNNVVANV